MPETPSAVAKLPAMLDARCSMLDARGKEGSDTTASIPGEMVVGASGRDTGGGVPRQADGLRVRPHRRSSRHQVPDHRRRCHVRGGVAIEFEHAISSLMPPRVLDRLPLGRGMPKVIRTDNDKKFCGKSIVMWAHVLGSDLRLNELGKPPPKRLRRVVPRPPAPRIVSTITELPDTAMVGMLALPA